MHATPLVSITIPCYEMHGRGAEFLEFGLSTIASQSYPRIEVIVSDHSTDNSLAGVCEACEDRLEVRCLRNPIKRGSSSANLNVAIKNSRGDLIKILCQDDYLFDDTAIERTVAAFRSTDMWLVTSYVNTRDRISLFNRHDPRMNPDIAVVNTIGTHSCLTIRNVSDPELFDEDLIWVMDCEYYRRLYDRFGSPAILDQVTVVQMLWDGQVTNTYASDEGLRRAEIEAVARRYPEPLAAVGSTKAVGASAGLRRTLNAGLRRIRFAPLML
jgi:glycosyltransferase involved in cell wall biosynthesis